MAAKKPSSPGLLTRLGQIFAPGLTNPAETFYPNDGKAALLTPNKYGQTGTIGGMARAQAMQGPPSPTPAQQAEMAKANRPAPAAGSGVVSQKPAAPRAAAPAPAPAPRFRTASVLGGQAAPAVAPAVDPNFREIDPNTPVSAVTGQPAWQPQFDPGTVKGADWAYLSPEQQAYAWQNAPQDTGRAIRESLAPAPAEQEAAMPTAAQPAAAPDWQAGFSSFGKQLGEGLTNTGNWIGQFGQNMVKPSAVLGGMRPISLLQSGLATLAAPTSQAAQVAMEAPGKFEAAWNEPERYKAEQAQKAAKAKLEERQVAVQEKNAASEAALRVHQGNYYDAQGNWMAARPGIEQAQEQGRTTRAQMDVAVKGFQEAQKNARHAQDMAAKAATLEERKAWHSKLGEYHTAQLAARQALATGSGNPYAGLAGLSLGTMSEANFKSLWSGLPPEAQAQAWKVGTAAVGSSLPAADRPAFLYAAKKLVAGVKMSPEEAAIMKKYVKNIMKSGTEDLAYKTGNKPRFDPNALPDMPTGTADTTEEEE
jgi:tetratricopeptide (TPR) repeat protein